MTSHISASAPCDLLAWDSDFFGCAIARIRGDTLDPGRVVEIDEWSQKKKIAVLYFLGRADSPQTIETAQAAGFQLVDIRVTLETKNFEAAPGVQDLPLDGEIRPASTNDIPALQAIARTAHRDTRFFSDGRFSHSSVEALYETWIRLECQGRAQQVLVPASAENRALGYISCHLDSKNSSGQIGLLGIDSTVRGKGLAKALLKEALRWFRQQGAEVVTVVTQGKNLAAQRLYQKSGFLISDLQLWFHKWYSGPDF